MALIKRNQKRAGSGRVKYLNLQSIVSRIRKAWKGVWVGFASLCRVGSSYIFPAFILFSVVERRSKRKAGELYKIYTLFRRRRAPVSLRVILVFKADPLHREQSCSFLTYKKGLCAPTSPSFEPGHTHRGKTYFTPQPTNPA